MGKPLNLIAMIMLLASSAQAEVLELQYRTIQGEERSKEPDGKVLFLNPAQSLTAFVSGGLDRYLQISVLNGASVAFEQTLGPIRVGDRHKTKNNRDFYGKLIDVPTLPEGEYVLKQTLLSDAGVVLKTEQHDLVVDRTPPSASTLSFTGNYGGGYQSNTHQMGVTPQGAVILSRVEMTKMWVDGVSDSLAGIESATYRYEGASGTHVSIPMAYDLSAGVLQLGNGTPNSVPKKAVPLESGSATLYVDIFDKAGNKTTVSRKAHNNSRKRGGPELFAYQREQGTEILGQANMQSYTGGEMHIEVNPPKLIYRVARSDYRQVPEGAIYGGSVQGAASTLLSLDDTHAYILVENVAISETNGANWPMVGWTNWSTWRTHPLPTPNPVFSPWTLAPKLVSMTPHIAGHGWINKNIGVATGDNTVASKTLPYNTRIDRIRVRAQPRVYHQVVELPRRQGSCVVPAHQEWCEKAVDLQWNQVGTIARYHEWRKIYRQDQKQLAATFAMTWMYDAEKPVYQSLSHHDKHQREITAVFNERNTGAFWGSVHLAAGGVILRQGPHKVELDGKITLAEGNINYIKTSYQSPTEGKWDLWVYGLDNYGNRTEQFIETIEMDNTPPKITVSVDDELLDHGQKVTGLESITLHVYDQHEGKLNALQLKGGPANDSVALEWNQKSAHSFGLEYPRLFPALKEGEDYQLLITAKDAFGNETSQTYSFLYEPNNIFTLNTISAIATEEPLFSSYDEPFIVIRSNILRTEDGNLATGLQTIFFTVRSDAAFGITVEGKDIAPGETSSIEYNIDNTGGKVELPINLSSPGEGSADFMMEIYDLN
ncbi:Ig-like domain-containing protein [Enterovibrio norvegicus]|uniref:Ig-like domain-containing protein n=1 Tax=Enterovibrio norvegicus TaxID=188144 RepID=UPI00352CB882